MSTPMLEGDTQPTPTEPLHGKAAVHAARKSLTSPWASAAVIVLTVLWTIPTFGLFVNSFRPLEAQQTSGWWTAFRHPDFTLQAYHDVLFNNTTGTGNFFPALVNSLAITIPATIIPIIIASMAAYVLAWVRFKGSDIIFFTIFALQVIPLQLALVPLQRLYGHGWYLTIGGHTFTVIPNPHLNGTLAEIWISHTMFSLPLAVFLLHNFISQLPESLIEAARVDGASPTRIYRTIVLPLSTPAIASFTIFQFIWVWNDLLVAKIFGGNDTQPVTARLQYLSGNYGAHPDLVAAGGFLAIVVPLIVFFTLQRFFVRGMLAGSVKG
jgi:alpha-glucoside transport system permease protein